MTNCFSGRNLHQQPRRIIQEVCRTCAAINIIISSSSSSSSSSGQAAAAVKRQQLGKGAM